MEAAGLSWLEKLARFTDKHASGDAAASPVLAENVHPFEELVPSCAENCGTTVSPVGG